MEAGEETEVDFDTINWGIEEIFKNKKNGNLSNLRDVVHCLDYRANFIVEPLGAPDLRSFFKYSSDSPIMWS